MKRSSFALVRVLALIGLAISAYLLIQKLNGTITSIKGCGGEGGCANVLGSKWSQLLGLPVSAFSTLFYLGIIGLTFKPQREILVTIALLLIGAALWFSGLQMFVIKSFCPWCLATHLIGLFTAIAIWRALPGAKVLPSTLVLASLGLAILFLGQIFGPEPKGYLISEEKISGDESIEAPADKRIVDMGVGKKIILGDSPYLGSAHAPHIFVKYFDYTCASCRDLESDLEKLQAKHPGGIAIILQPCPLNRACNSHLPPRVHDHDYACELARLSLASWIAKPEAFKEVHELLFSRPILTPAVAQEKVAAIIGSAELENALKDPRIERILLSNANDYRQLVSKNIKMPKLLIGKGRMLQGLMKDSETFISAMEKALPLE
ncbi:vitamin K epoxide reductase family protein [bacterium]|nr:vitamin K epoxide reductase family protein [bacterium]MDC0315141.1 vitamin K epoxide reductase family protein [bacterium]